MHVLYINEQSVGRVNLWSRSARLCSHATFRISHRHMDLVWRSKIMKIWKSWFLHRKNQYFDFLKNVPPIDCCHPTALTATGSIVFDVLVVSCGPKSPRPVIEKLDWSLENHEKIKIFLISHSKSDVSEVLGRASRIPSAFGPQQTAKTSKTMLPVAASAVGCQQSIGETFLRKSKFRFFRWKNQDFQIFKIFGLRTWSKCLWLILKLPCEQSRVVRLQRFTRPADCSFM